MNARGHGCRRGVALVCRLFYPEYGGPGISVWRLVPRLRESGIELLVFARHLPGALRTEKLPGVKIQRCGSRGRGRLAEARFISSILVRLIRQRDDYDGIHVFASGWISFLIPLLGRILGKTTCFTMTLLDSDDPEAIARQRQSTVKLRLFRMYDRVIYINPEQARRFEQVYGTAEPLVAGSLGIDVDTFHPPSPEERAAAREHLGLAPDAPVAAFTGAVTKRKGVDRVADIWLKVVQERPDARILLLGPLARPEMQVMEEYLYPDLRQRIEQEGRTANFRFLDESRDVGDVVRVLHAADVFLFPSRREGTPSSVMEAMSCGCVPALTPLEGFTGEVARDGVEGLVLDPDDFHEAAQRIVDLFRDDETCRAMGRRSRRRICETHSQQVALDSLLEAWGRGARETGGG